MKVLIVPSKITSGEIVSILIICYFNFCFCWMAIIYYKLDIFNVIPDPCLLINILRYFLITFVSRFSNDLFPRLSECNSVVSREQNQ